MMKPVTSPKISKAISDLRSISNNHHKNVLTPLEKYCADRMVDQFMKSPSINLYLKMKVCEQLS